MITYEYIFIRVYQNINRMRDVGVAHAVSGRGGLKASQHAPTEARKDSAKTRANTDKETLQFIANDPLVAQKLLNFAAIVFRDSLRIEPIECLPVVLALIEDRAPTQAGLRSFENEKFKQLPVVVDRHPPLEVVVLDR